MSPALSEMSRDGWIFARRLILLLICLIASGGCSSMFLGGGSTAGRPIGDAGASARPEASDQRIIEIIEGRYAADSELSASGLSVSSVGGVVTLRGQVNDYALRDRAVSLARDVAGVGRVINQVGIKR